MRDRVRDRSGLRRGPTARDYVVVAAPEVHERILDVGHFDCVDPAVYEERVAEFVEPEEGAVSAGPDTADGWTPLGVLEFYSLESGVRTWIAAGELVCEPPVVAFEDVNNESSGVRDRGPELRQRVDQPEERRSVAFGDEE